MTQKSFALIVICVICVTVHLPLSFVSEARALTAADLLTKQVRATAIKNETFDQVLDRLTSDYQIPIGIVLGDEKLIPRREFDLNLPETTVKDFLDAVIAKDPRYTWKLEEGVIHFQPSKERDALLTTLLDTKISHFAFTEGTSRYRIYSEILKLPEIQTQLIVADVAPIVLLSSGTMRKVGISFQESNVTLRELLDRFILRTESKRWVLMRWGKNGEYITLRS
jgi:hypothetical protein